MKQYAVNTENSRIVYDNLGAGFQSLPWRILDENNQDDIILINNFNLKEEKDEKLRQLEKNRKAYQFKDINLDGVSYVATKTASGNLMSTIEIMKLTDLNSVNWLDVNNNIVILSLVDAQNLAILMFNQYTNAYISEAEKIQLINNASSLEDLENIDINIQ